MATRFSDGAFPSPLGTEGGWVGEGNVEGEIILIQLYGILVKLYDLQGLSQQQDDPEERSTRDPQGSAWIGESRHRGGDNRGR
jgi:DNA-directed RNA polymerase subunit E'/Rpb7